jgi:hypothetical protein
VAQDESRPDLQAQIAAVRAELGDQTPEMLEPAAGSSRSAPQVAAPSFGEAAEAAIGIRTYVSEPKRGRRKWQCKSAEKKAAYGNRRRVRSRRGKRWMRLRGERVERSFAHCYETGGMRRTHLRGHPNILKRLLIHVAGFNLGLVMRSLFGIGKPRVLQGLEAGLLRRFCDSAERWAATWSHFLLWLCYWSRSSDLPDLQYWLRDGLAVGPQRDSTTGC